MLTGPATYRPATLHVIAATFATLTALLANVELAQAQQQDQDSVIRQTVRQACSDDYRALCVGVIPGGGRAVACLKQNAAQLSPGCFKALQAAKAARPAPATAPGQGS